MVSHFPTDKEEALIDAVQCSPTLYDKSDKDYCNRQAVQRLWNEIADELECEAALCKSKWQSLRDYFIKKKREYERSKGQSNKRPWHLYQRMSFILPYAVHRPANMKLDLHSSPEDSGEEEASEASQSMTFKNSPESVHSAGVGAELHDNDPIDSFEVVKNHRGKKRKIERGSPNPDSKFSKFSMQPDNDHELFFRSLIPTVSQLDEINTMYFRSEVQQLAAKYLRQQRGIASNESTPSVSQSDCNEKFYTTLN
ncbi:transcription factor Adf-1 [Elysia marginata]|uniref:Transcription factor Adf-1 n=1 Tax=Elysia marginata TaxID=1093978 RepID=A0AAV4G3I3_9GAST|nr:transcription factor Adf-1 [Elysia marginata]